MSKTPVSSRRATSQRGGEVTGGGRFASWSRSGHTGSVRNAWLGISHLVATLGPLFATNGSQTICTDSIEESSESSSCGISSSGIQRENPKKVKWTCEVEPATSCSSWSASPSARAWQSLSWHWCWQSLQPLWWWGSSPPVCACRYPTGWLPMSSNTESSRHIVFVNRIRNERPFIWNNPARRCLHFLLERTFLYVKYMLPQKQRQPGFFWVLCELVD